MIIVENLTKQFGNQILLEHVGFQINPAERIGLVGRNGHGKTTLLRILVGEESYESGSVVIPKHYRVGYVRQKISFSKHTVLEEGMAGLQENERDHYWKVEKVLAGLGFSENDMRCRPEELSAGFQVRLNLTKALVFEPDLLLLDEPTNYLDILSIRWIERFLQNWPRELIVVTHDRTFMDSVVTHIMGIHRRNIRKIYGTTEKYYDQIVQDEQVYERTRLKDERRRKEIEQFINRFRAKARLANLVQSRIKTLSRIEKRRKLYPIKALDFSFRSRPLEGREVLQAKAVCFSYHTDHQILKDFSLTVSSRDRICVVGKNGKGKTTLLKLLAGVLLPQKGTIHYNPGVVKGIFDPGNVAGLLEPRTVEEEILSAHPDVSRQVARNICGAMMFEGDDALKKIGVLSGGEKSRVLLGKILATPVNLLILDEPTNHLDMDSSDALLAAIDNFDGAVIMVTHNEMLLHAVAERLVVFQNSRVDVLDGTYQYFLDSVGWEPEKASLEALSKKCGQRNTKKELRRRRSRLISERARILRPLAQRMTAVEQDIEMKEDRIKVLCDAMSAASTGRDATEIIEISKAMHACTADVDRLYEELEKVMSLIEEKNADFEEQFKRLDQQTASEGVPDRSKPQPFMR